MRTDENRALLELLRALAQMRNRLAEFRRHLLKSLKPASVEWNVECNDYEGGLVLSAYLDADLGNGSSVVWWLDVRPDGERWCFDPRVTWKGQDEILPLGEYAVVGSADFLRELPRSLAFLTETHDRVLGAVQVANGTG